MPTVQRFESSFWPPSSAILDFSKPLSVLHSKLQQSRVENDEIIAYIKERIAVEEQYAIKLEGLSKVKGNSLGFLKDEGATLKKSFDSVKGESDTLGEEHKRLAANLKEKVLNLLVETSEEYKKRVTSAKVAMDIRLKQFDTLLKETDKAKAIYVKRCRDADTAEEAALKTASGKMGTTPQLSPLPIMNGIENIETDSKNQHLDYPDRIIVELASKPYNQQALDALARRMQKEITTKDFKAPVLGIYHNTSTGADITVWMQRNHPSPDTTRALTIAECEQIGQQLHDQGYFRLVSSRGKQFQALPNNFYQWRQQDDSSSVSSSQVTGVVGGLLERMNVSTGKDILDEPHYKKARKESEKADEMYRSSVKRADQYRMVIEETLFAHYSEMETAELERIRSIKNAFLSFSSILGNSMTAAKAIFDHLHLYQESLRPDHDIQQIIAYYRTGSFVPRPILYENYYHGTAVDQCFGVAIEEATKETPKKIPPLLELALAAIERGSATFSEGEKQMIWTTPIPLDRVHAARAELNDGHHKLTLEHMDQNYDPLLLAGIVRLYLMELPECLLTYEFYDPVKILYSTNDQDGTTRLVSVSHLIATLPPASFATLDLLISHIRSIINLSTTEDGTPLPQLSHSLGNILLRPKIETSITLHDKHPKRLVDDLLSHHDQIFTEQAYKSHRESVKRRAAVPLRIRSVPYLGNGDPNIASSPGTLQPPRTPKTPDPTTQQKRRSFMGFMSRQSIDDDGAKKSGGVFSIIGQGRSVSAPVMPTTSPNSLSPNPNGDVTLHSPSSPIEIQTSSILSLSSSPPHPISTSLPNSEKPISAKTFEPLVGTRGHRKKASRELLHSNEHLLDDETNQTPKNKLSSAKGRQRGSSGARTLSPDSRTETDEELDPFFED